MNLALLGVTLLSASACAPNHESRQHEPPPPEVIVSLPVVHHIVRPMLPDSIAIYTLIDGPMTPHGYELRPSQARRISDAAAVITAAQGVDEWMGRASSDAPHVLFLPDSGDREFNPHGWTDPVRVRSTLPSLTTYLCDHLPESCDEIRMRSAAFSDSLDAVVSHLANRLHPLKDMSFVMSEPFFAPFLDRFGVSVADVLRAVPGHDPSPEALLRAIESTAGIDGIIVQSIGQDRLATELARTRGTPVVYIDPIGLAYPDYFTYLNASADSLLTIPSRR